MKNTFVGTHSPSFDPETYIRILIAIAKADKDNGPREFGYVRKQAKRLGLDYDLFVASTKKTFVIEKRSVSRVTALTILKDAIALASMDRNFSLPEREKIYSFATRMDISRRDLEHLEEWIQEYKDLREKWNDLVAGEL